MTLADKIFEMICFDNMGQKWRLKSLTELDLCRVSNRVMLADLEVMFCERHQFYTFYTLSF